MAAEGEKEALTFDGVDFQEDFDSECYLQQFFPGCDPENPEHGWTISAMRLVHQIFDGGKYSGKTLLDICSGPTLYSVMSASKYFSNIYLCDYAAPNREALRKWVSRDPSAHDWSPFFNYVASLEGGSSDKIEQRLHNAIKGVLHCDLRKDHPFGREQETLTPVDAVLSFNTLEVIVKEDEYLADYHKKFYSMLNDGGLFMTTVVEKVSYYYQAGKRYWSRGFPKKMVEESLIEAGFTDVHSVDIEAQANVSVKQYSNTEGFVLFYATKRA